MKKSTFLCAMTLLSVMAFNMEATTAPLCSSEANYQQLINLGTGGCTIGSLLFNDFTFAGSSLGVGTTPVATQLTFTIDQPGTAANSLDPIWGFEFDPNIAVIGIGAEDEILQYDITGTFPIIDSNELLMTGLQSATGAIATVAEGPDCGKTTATAVCTNLPTLTATTGSPIQEVTGIGPFITEHVYKDINVTSLTTSGFATISNVRDTVDLVRTPEPATFMLFGAAFLLLGVIRRKRTD